MRLFVQIIAILTFLLAGSQFTHAHEISATPHVHAHDMQASHSDQTLHSGMVDAQHAEMGGSVHCGAYLLSLAAAPGLAFPPRIRSFINWHSDRRRSGRMSLELPPPRA